MGVVRLMVRVVKGTSLRRALLWGAALASLTSLVLPSSLAEARPLLAPAPSVSLGVPAQVPLGEPFSFSVTFDNASGTSTDVGYGPILDLIFPVNGADGNAGAATPDGITFVSASYLGVALNSTVLPFPDADGAGPGTTGCVNHPYYRNTSGVRLQVCGTAGDALVVLQLPFGSFAPDQPAITVSVQANLSNLADLGTGLTLKARGGFRFGADPLDNWCCDAVIVNPASIDGTGWPSASVAPTLLTLAKAYSGPENETATGPNFPRRYTLTAGIADAQSVNNLTIADTLSSNLQFTSVVSTSPAAVCTPPPAGIPGGTLSCDFGAGPVSGSPNVVFEYFIPQFDAGGGSVLPPPSGDDRTSPDNVRASASWDPDDGRDPVTPLTINAAGPEHTLNDRSIAIQKSASPGSGTPGTVVTYTLSFQISDYFTFGDLVATDTISDGQRLLMGPGFEPSLSVTDRVETRGGLFAYTPPAYPPNPPNPPAPGDDLLIDVSRIGNSGPGVPPDGTDGSTLLTFEVSDALIRLGAADGILQGGRAIVPNAGPATGTITYYARIQDVFSDTYPSTDPSVDQGDRLSNSVSITGTIRNNALITQVDGVEDDGSGAGVTIARGPVTKSLYAINGGSPTPPRVAPGDTVTYRITYEMPASDVEDLYFIDYLPLPVFDVADPNAEAPGVPVWTYLAAAAPGTLPAPGEVTRGLTDTFSGPTGISGISPLLTPTGSSNSLRIFYGSFDDSSNRASKIDLLFTITVTQDPFADGLFLTNQLRQHEGSTNAGPDDTDVIIQIQVQEPVLFLTKGVGATDNPAGAFAPPQVGPLSVTFNPPGSNPSWTGLVSSGGLSGPPPRPIDSNLGGVDAGDLATFALVIENQGTSPYGAFDIRLRDLLAPGYVIPSTGLGLNLQIRRGSGTPIGYQALNTSGVAVGAPNTQPEYLFYDVGPNHGGLELLDPSDAEGVCQGHNLGSGANIVILTYDLQLAPGVAPNTVNTNTASVTQYASRNGGPNFLDPGGPLTDQATVTTALPVVTKTITGTNQAHTLLTNVAIGERVTYQLVITIPEGVSNNATVVDTLDSGLAFVSLDSLTASADLSTSIGGEFPQVLTTARAGLAAPGGAATYSFGTLTNSNRVNAAPETITITYTAVVLNSPGNDRGVGRNNSAVISWTGGSASGAAPNVVIVEPTLQAAKAAVPNSGDAGDTIAFTLTFSHTAASNADAFNVTLNDPLPAGMTYVGTSLNCTSGVQDPDSSFFATGVITASWASFLDNGTTGICTFQVTLNDDVEPGQVIINTANLAWTSLPGDVTTPQSTLNGLSTERTGDTANPGGAENDYRASGPATVTILQVPVKSLAETSESHTGDPAVAIGEIVRYHLAFQLAEGIATNLRLQDELPPGMQFLNDSTAMVAFVSNGPGITSTTIIPGPACPGLVITGNSAAVTPTCPLPDTAVSSSDTVNDDTYASGTDVYLKLGTLDNRDRDVDGEFAVIEFNALVENVVGNAAGTPLSNDFIPRVGTTAFPASNSLVVTVAVPSIALTKAVTTLPSDAGDTLVYTLTATNTAGANAAAAFDLSIADTIDSRLAIQSVSGSTTGGACGATPSAFAGSFLLQQVTATATCLNPGGVMTTIITARVANDVQVGSTIPNIANLTYTTLPGLTGTSPNPTGSTTPGGSGSPTGERALTGQANASHTLATPAVTKLAPIPAQQTIGGEADYDLLVTLPEGAVTNLRIRDALPVGLGYVSHGIITTAAASGGILAADYNGTLTTTPTVVVSGGTLEFQFGDVQTNGSGPGNGTSANQFVVRVRTRVLNEVGNQNGTLLVNTANLGYVNPQTGDTTVLDGLRTLTVIEPELQLTKLADDDTPGLGQTVTYTLVVEHLPSSTADALDLVVVDVLPLGLTYLGGSAAGPAGWSAAYNGLTRELTFQASVLTLASGSAALIYQVEVDSPPPPNIGDVLTNNAVLTWTSLPGPDAGERTGGGGVNDYTATATESLTVTGIDLVLTKDDVVASVSPGEDLAYTLTYQNVGNADATGVVITDVVPDYTTFNPGASTPGWTCLPNNNAGSTCTLALAGSVLGGAPAVPVTFAVTVDASVPVMVTLLQNAASITDDGTHGIEPTPADNTDSETTPLVAAPDLTITKDDGLDIVSPGSLLVYAINYANVGDQDATGVVVTETVPLATTFVAASSLPTVWSCPDGSTGGTVCTMTIGNLAAGASGALTFAVRIADPVPALTTQVVDTITIADDGTNGPEPPTGNNTDTDTDNLVTLPNADLTKTLDTTNQAHTLDPAVAIGEILTYQLELTIPQGTMTSAALTDVVDLGLAFVRCVSLTPSPGLTTIPAGAFAAACASPTVAEEPAGSGAAEDQGRRVTFNLGSMTSAGPGVATLTLIYEAVVIDNPGNVRGVNLNNGVTWTWVGGQLIESAPDVSVVEPTLTLAKDATPRSVPPGGLVTFTVTVNHPAPPSNSPAFDLELTDTVPLGMTYVPGSLTASPGGTIDDTAAPSLRVTWPVLDLNDSVTATFQATMGQLPAGTRIRNDAYLSWSTLPLDFSAPQSIYNVLSTERVYDPPINANVVVAIPALPGTGYAPGRVTELPSAPSSQPYEDLGDLVLEIPSLGVRVPIVGVPSGDEGWDLTWLWNQAGHLEGTAYPGWDGNSALTAHVYRPDGRPGPFVRLDELGWDDPVIVHANGQRYEYRVRQVERVVPGNLSALRHESQPWLTLLTCQGYDEIQDKYLWRLAVRAVLVDVSR